MEYVNTIRIRELNKDAVSLLSSHPLQGGCGRHVNAVAYSSNNINQIYQIHGISSYRDFIFPSLATTTSQSAQDITMLKNILASNPDVDTRFTSLVFQDIIREYSDNIFDVTHKFVKSALKFTLPLAGSLLLLGGLKFIRGRQWQWSSCRNSYNYNKNSRMLFYLTNCIGAGVTHF